MSERVLVTGGAGFIGSHLVDRLIHDGFEVAVIDDLSTGSADYLNKNAVFFQKDVADTDALNRLFQDFKPAYVFHLAAHADVVSSVDNPQQDAVVNIIGTINVVKAAIENRAKKVIFTSSAAVYGVPDAPVVSEESATIPVSPYGLSKLAGEHYVRVLTESSSDTEYVAARLSNVYGPRQGIKNEAGVISIFIQRILAGREIVVYGNGRAKRDFVYVADVVDALIRAMKRGKGVFNISTGKTVSVNQVIEIIERYTGSARKILKPLRPGEIESIALDNNRAVDELGWKPVISLEEGVRQTVEFWKEEKNGI